MRFPSSEKDFRVDGYGPAAHVKKRAGKKPYFIQGRRNPAMAKEFYWTPAAYFEATRWTVFRRYRTSKSAYQAITDGRPFETGSSLPSFYELMFKHKAVYVGCDHPVGVSTKNDNTQKIIIRSLKVYWFSILRTDEGLTFNIHSNEDGIVLRSICVKSVFEKYFRILP
jgi:hypothetical protein